MATKKKSPNPNVSGSVKKATKKGRSQRHAHHSSGK